MAWSTEGIFAFTHVFEQRLGQRRQDGIDILVGVLFDLGGDIFGRTQRVFEEAHLHAQIVEADIER
ncbi:hypothetical protein D3C75_1071820 [compost metagenome]